MRRCYTLLVHTDDVGLFTYCVLYQQAGVEPNDFTRHALIKALQSGGRETENVLTAIMQEFNKQQEQQQ
jgi:hypothetical protein